MKKDSVLAEPLHDKDQAQTLTGRIRHGFAVVAGLADHVAIRHDRLDAYAASLPDRPVADAFDPAHHYIGSLEDTAAYVLTLDAINFGSGYTLDMATEGWNLVDGSIYFTVSTRLKERFERHGRFDAAALGHMDGDRVKDLLRLPDGIASSAFAGLCADSLRDMGHAVAQAGSFEGYVAAAGGSAETMAAMLGAIASFRDEQAYKGHVIPFYKRAQIAAADLHLAFARTAGGAGRPLFNDLDRLTMFADNGVPHVLRMDGILDYTTALARRIDNREAIAPGSAEEVEIRACAGHAVELLAARKGFSAVNIDHILWHRSVENARYRALPSHRTRTMFY